MTVSQIIFRCRSLRPPNKDSVKAHVVGPILAALGWQVDDPAQVLYSHRVSNSSERQFDIVLVAPDGTEIASLDIEYFGSRLGYPTDLQQSEHFGGVRSYILTNGHVWKFYRLSNNDLPEDCCFAVLRLAAGDGESSEASERLERDFQKYLSRRAVLDGSALAAARRALVTRNRRVEAALSASWSRLVGEASPDLVRLIQTQVFDSIGVSPSRDRVVRMLAGVNSRPGAGAGVKLAVSPFPPDAEPHPTPDEIRVPATNVKLGTRPVAFELFGERCSVKTNAAVLIKVAATLYQRHSPVFAERVKRTFGRGLPWISMDPNDLPTSSTPRRIPDSPYFVALFFHVRYLRTRWCRLLEAFGYDPDELTLVYDPGSRYAPSSSSC